MTTNDSNQYTSPSQQFLETVLYQMPNAYASLAGTDSNSPIEGIVRFYSMGKGVLVHAEVYGLPVNTGDCGVNIHGFHIHEGGSCTGNAQDPFANAGDHYNPSHCPHPAHAGDLPPLFSNHGFAWMLYYTEQFTIGDIIKRTVIVHEKPDDFMTQPAGNSGKKLACGIIQYA